MQGHGKYVVMLVSTVMLVRAVMQVRVCSNASKGDNAD